MIASMNIMDPALRVETQIHLPEDEVHLWRVDLAGVAPAEEQWKQILSEDERTRAGRFHFSRDRQFFIATRALLRTILGGYAACDPSQLAFRYSDKQKPSLDNRFSKRLEFNLSHSGTTAMLAFARGRALGIDVEQIRDDFDTDTIARRFFSAHEVRQLFALDPAERHEAFFRCWTRKEAYIKAVGTGLSLPLGQFDVSLEPGDANALLSTRPESAEAARWSLRDIPAGEACLAALCVQGHGWRLKSWSDPT